MYSVAAISLAAALASAAYAADEHPARDPQERICRVDKETGSRIASRRTCMTRAEWDELASATRRELERAGIDRRQRD